MTDATAQGRELDAHWFDVLSPALIPLVIAAGYTYAAMTPTDEWTWAAGWVLGILLLAPADFMRIVAMDMLGDSFREGRDPRDAVRGYLIKMRVLGLVILAWLIFDGPFFYVLMHPGVLTPALAIVGDGAIALYYFRGDARKQADRIKAVVDDSIDWLRLSLFAMPFSIALIVAALTMLRNRGFPMPPSIPPEGLDAITRLRAKDFSIPDFMPNLDILRSAVLLNVAIYFIGKAAIFANVHTARFDRTQKRLLEARWIQRLGD